MLGSFLVCVSGRSFCTVGLAFSFPSRVRSVFYELPVPMPPPRVLYMRLFRRRMVYDVTTYRECLLFCSFCCLTDLYGLLKVK